MKNDNRGKKDSSRRKVIRLEEILEDKERFDEEDEDNVTDDTLEFLSLDDETIEAYEKNKKHSKRKVYEEDDESDYEDEDYEEDDDADYEDEDYEEDDDTDYEDEDYEEDDDADYEDEDYEEDDDADYEDEDYEEDDDTDYEDEDYEEDDESDYEDEDYEEDDDADYEDDDYEDDDEDDDEDEYDYGYDEPETFGEKISYFLTHLSTLDMVVAMLGILVVVGACVTGGIYAHAKTTEKQVAAFAEIGNQLGGVTLIGESGLDAVAQAAMTAVQEEEEEIELAQEEENEKDDKQITVNLNITSIQSDIKVKFVNQKTGKLIGSVPFVVSVSGGKKDFEMKDDDKDGIIHQTGVAAGTYKVLIKALEGEQYKDYLLPSSASSVTVSDQIAYKKVDVADEVKTEAEVNVAAEDTAVQDTAQESSLTDTVEWVESTKTEMEGDGNTSYEAVDKKTITDPWTVSSAFRKMVSTNQEGENSNTGEGGTTSGDSTGNTSSGSTENPSSGSTGTPSSGSTENPSSGSTETKDFTVNISNSSLSLERGKTATLSVSVDGVSGYNVDWSSSDSSIATVSGGTVTANGVGSATITAKVTAEGKEKSATCQVTVTEEPKPAEITASISSSSLSLEKGKTGSLSVSVSGVSSYTTEWSSSNTSIATVKDGTVTAVAAGSAKITATVKSGNASKTVECQVTVTEPKPADITVSISNSSMSILKGKTGKLTVSVNGSTSYTTEWSSSNTSIATVKDGTVTAVAVGNATITAKVKSGNVEKSATCQVTVTDDPNAIKKVTITGATEVAIGKTITLTATTDPKGEKVKWSSDNEKIAKVDANGVVTGVAEGSAVIKAVCEKNTNITATYTVKVKKAVNVDGKTKLKDKNGNQLYYKEGDSYKEATYDDYKKYDTFYKKSVKYRYTGWQTIDGSTYFFDKNGNYVTGDQVIQGAKYSFGSDGRLSSGSGSMGIDVSKWNGSIDWNAVKNSGVSYVIIRCGYRGSSTGALIEDPKFKSNIQGAKAAGLQVGVYFFSQAVNEVEAVEEASMALNLVKGYGLNYPIFLDVESSGGRGDGVSRDTRTAVCKAFCATIQNSGYAAGVYANKTWFTEMINTGSLTGYKIWLAQYASAPTYKATRYDMWQYSSKGQVSGIKGNVDMNISYMR